MNRRHAFLAPCVLLFLVVGCVASPAAPPAPAPIQSAPVAPPPTQTTAALALPAAPGAPTWPAARVPAPTPTAAYHLDAVQVARLDVYGRGLAWSPDGRVLASGEFQIDLFDTQTWQPLCQLPVKEGWVEELGFSPDGAILAAALRPGVEQWEPGTWAELPTLPASGPSESLAFSPDGTLLATGSGAAIKLWDAATGDELRAIPVGEDPDMDGPVSLVFSRDGETLAAGWFSGIGIWDVSTGERVAFFPPAAAVDDIALAPDGQTLAVAYATGDVVLLDLSSGRSQNLMAVETPIRRLEFSPDGRLLVATADIRVFFWDTADWHLLATSSAHTHDVEAIAFSPDGSLLATGSMDVRIWRLEWSAGQPEPGPTGIPPAPVATPVPLSKQAITPENAGQVAQAATLEDATYCAHIAWSPDGRWLALASDVLHIYDAQTLQLAQQLEVQPLGLAFSPDGSVLATSGPVRDDPEVDYAVVLWEVGTWSKRQVLEDSQEVEDVAFAPNGRLLAGEVNGGVKVWDLASGGEPRTIPVSTISDIAFSPDGRLMAVASGARVRFYDTATWTELNGLVMCEWPHVCEVDLVAFSPDGQLLATGMGSQVELWDVTTGSRLRTLEGHTMPVPDLAFSPDGRLLATASWDLTVRLWDVATGAAVRTLTGHIDEINQVAFSPDGATLASAGYESMVRLWQVAR